MNRCYAFTWYGKKPCLWRCWDEHSECRALYEEEEE